MHYMDMPQVQMVFFPGNSATAYKGASVADERDALPTVPRSQPAAEGSGQIFSGFFKI